MGAKMVTISKTDKDKVGTYKLQVKDSRKSWFVFLDECQITWLQGILQTAAMKDWRFSSMSIKKSGSRIGKSIRRREEFLQISEQTYNGRVFKVLIPASGNNRGWAKLIHLLKDFYKMELQARVHQGCYASSALPDSVPKPDYLDQSISYADAVRYGGGRCHIKQNQEGRFIDVGSEGVKERTGII
ncbi:unnamed protein product [Linum trigynum]|uniref:Uncharacterized protein n=1 Tax=Linum trigynum TaxID=586398 RepID=A0AAV2FBR8_9ROSI